MISTDFSAEFNFDYKSLIKTSPDLKELILTKIVQFCRNFEDERLNNHALRKPMEGKWSFSITNDVRIVYLWTGKNNVRFLAIGGHGKVYGKKS